MKQVLVAAVAISVVLPAPALSRGSDRKVQISLQPLASIATQSAGTTGAEIVAFDAKTRRAFAINSSDNDLVVIDLANPSAPQILNKVSMNAFGAGLNSVDARNGLVAVAVEAAPKTDPGKVVFLDASSLAILGSVTVGAQPDMITFTKNGERVLVANEGEPNSYGQPTSVNPEGSISIITLRDDDHDDDEDDDDGDHRRSNDDDSGFGVKSVRTASFAAFNSQRDQLIAQGVRIYGPGATVAQDLEPEYITQRGRTAWVTLQEANAIAIVDIPTATVREIRALGLKDHSALMMGLDPSDRDGPGNSAKINIGNWPVFGMYQPDAIAQFRVGRQTYLLTANEGDSRSAGDFPGFEEEVRVGSSSYVLDPVKFPNAAALKTNAALARLTVTNASGDTDGDGDFDRIQVFGARSLSIWKSDGTLVWDSGDSIEQFIANPASGWSTLFNAGNTNNSLDDRSDNKGPEPEGVAVGRVAGRTFAFVGLERVGGVMAWDVSSPEDPTFAAYANTRTLGALGGDLGAEGVEFVSADDSPSGKALVLIGNEVSRTVSVLQVNYTRSRN